MKFEILRSYTELTKKQFGVRIEEEILKEWHSFCSQYGLKMADHVEKALKNYIKYYKGMVGSADKKFMKQPY